MATGINARPAAADYWSDKTVFAHAGSLEVASISYEVRTDFSKPVVDAFSFTVTLRALGVYLGSTTVDPIKNGPVAIDIIQPIGGRVEGRIDNWSALNAEGAPSTDPAWNDASVVSFLITGTANTTLPITAILALVPGIGWLARAALALLGSGVTVNLGHKLISLPIHRDASGRPVNAS